MQTGNEVANHPRLLPLDVKATAPALLSERQVAELLGLSVRSVKTLRYMAWFPEPLQLGERSLRWPRDELLAALAANAPRVRRHQEPKQLADARAKRCQEEPKGQVFRAGKRVA